MISIVIPVYNEAENILRQLEEIKKKVNSVTEVLIIYDFDEDSTLPVIKDNYDSFRDLNVLMIKNDIAPGVVNALKKGFSCVKGDYVLVLMADLSDDLTVVGGMVKKMEEGYDIVCGSRYMKGGKQIGGGIFKKTLSSLAGKSLHILTRIPTNDVTNNFKLYRRSVLENIRIESIGGFEIAMEITVKAFKKGYKITEISSIWTDRSSGHSNFKIWKWIPHYLRWYYYCIFKFSS
jgi:dolichol-phosphate mannosyltransferase